MVPLPSHRFLLAETTVHALYHAALLSESPDSGIIAFSINNGVAGDDINRANIQAFIDYTEVTTLYYENGLPQRDLNQTTHHGGGVIINVPEGPATITWVGLPDACTQRLGHRDINHTETPVYSGQVSIIRIECSD